MSQLFIGTFDEVFLIVLVFFLLGIVDVTSVLRAEVVVVVVSVLCCHLKEKG